MGHNSLGGPAGSETAEPRLSCAWGRGLPVTDHPLTNSPNFKVA